ncbi:flagellar export protein FliJ [Dyella koreensis]|uniref:Flagellar FliJ protein n=1 Tax=Dyella koreensis TaxID=311235 RepID=A0ABW8K5J2_9GAMM
MSMGRTVNSLARLVDLRGREVERLTGELAGQQAMRKRYENNLTRMEQLLHAAAPSDQGCPVLSSNSALYKAWLADLIASHRQDLAHHDTVIAASRGALTIAALKHEGLGRVLHDKRALLERQHRVREQKQQDQLATQAWSRSRLQA